ncbi:MAG: RHS repeat-associated core domain-containing protein [Bryobacterales bacterium]|nr:RHS repeat-associated core domain-containing protein [Bryobacterales bacterium]
MGHHARLVRQCLASERRLLRPGQPQPPAIERHPLPLRGTESRLPAFVRHLHPRHLHQLRLVINRYYSATTGRFLSPDPYQASGGPADPGSWNRYSYVQGDPVNWFDPSGLQRQAPIFYCEWDDNELCIIRVAVPAEADDPSRGPVPEQPGRGTPDSFAALLTRALDLMIEALREREFCRGLFGNGARPPYEA